MAPHDPVTWERWKNAIHALYIVQKKPLQGPDGVIETMKTRHGFVASKAEYTRHLSDWAFTKNVAKESWQVIRGKIDKRGRYWKPTNIYQDGVLIPPQKVRIKASRQGFMNTFDALRMAHGTSPRTPVGFEIRTPSADSVVRLEFEGLPILRYQGALYQISQYLEHRPQSTAGVMELIGKSLDFTGPNAASGLATALLPLAALAEEGPGFELFAGREPSGPIQLLNMATYVITNNLLSETQASKIYKWLKAQNIIDSGALASSSSLPIFEGPTGEALRENIFRLAIQESDVAMVKRLLSAGQDPNAPLCTLPQTLLRFTPLQYACLLGHTSVVRSLLEVGASGEDDTFGWNGSILILAMFRCTIDYGEVASRCADDIYQIMSNKCQGDGEDGKLFNSHIRLVSDLVALLLSYGADMDSVSPAEGQRKDPETFEFGGINDWMMPFKPMVAEIHSPLTFASKFCFTPIVRVLIQAGADVNHSAEGVNPALRECLYPRYHWTRERGEDNTRELEDEELHWVPHVRDGIEHGDIVGTVSALISAGAGPGDHAVCEGNEEHDEYMCHSVLDLAMSICGDEFSSVFGLLAAEGARPSVHTLRLAARRRNFHVFRHVVDILPFSLNTTLPGWVVDWIDQNECVFGLSVIELVSRKGRKRKKPCALILAGLAIGTLRDFESLLQSIRVPHMRSAFPHLDPDATLCFEEMEDLAPKLRLLKNTNFFQGASPQFLGLLLTIACRDREYETAEELISAGASVNELVNGDRPITLALLDANPSLTKQLLAAGARLEVPAKHPSKCCHLDNLLVQAIQLGDYGVVDELLFAPGTDINSLGMPDWDYSGWGIELSERIDFLGGLCLSPRYTCCSPLTMAIIVRDLPLARMLQLAGARVNSKCESGRGGGYLSPLAASMEYGLNPMFATSLLDEGADLEDDKAWAMAARDKDATAFLISQLWRLDGSQRSRPPTVALCEALKSREARRDVSELLLESGFVDINAFVDRCTPFYHALRSPDQQMRPDLVHLLLRHGANPDAVVLRSNRRGMCAYEGTATALMAAVGNRYYKERDDCVVELLLEYGADVNRVSDELVADYPIQLAARFASPVALRLLLERGADPNKVSLRAYRRQESVHKGNMSAIQSATEKRMARKVRMLLEHGAKPDLVTSDTPHTALQIACRNRDEEIASLLIEYGADINAPPAEWFGATALQFSAIGGCLGLAHTLVHKGARVNAPPARHEGRTAIEGAAEHGRSDMVQFLRNSEADISGPDFDRALDMSLRNGHNVTRKLLISYLS